jgi:hypothetical protein
LWKNKAGSLYCFARVIFSLMRLLKFFADNFSADIYEINYAELLLSRRLSGVRVRNVKEHVQRETDCRAARNFEIKILSLVWERAFITRSQLIDSSFCASRAVFSERC